MCHIFWGKKQCSGHVVKELRKQASPVLHPLLTGTSGHPSIAPGNHIAKEDGLHFTEVPLMLQTVSRCDKRFRTSFMLPANLKLYMTLVYIDD